MASYTSEMLPLTVAVTTRIAHGAAAEHWPQVGVAILLTGMGKDGAKGLATLRGRGWHTIAQDEATSVVWSMPKAAIDTGAACEVLAIDQMARVVTARLGG